MSEICERCQAKDTIIEDDIEGIVVCTNCGLVLEENIIDEQYEKRTFEIDSNKTQRVGPPTSHEQATESGTYLVKTKNGYTKKTIIYPNKQKKNKKSKKKSKKIAKELVNYYLRLKLLLL